MKLEVSSGLGTRGHAGAQRVLYECRQRDALGGRKFFGATQQILVYVQSRLHDMAKPYHLTICMAKGFHAGRRYPRPCAKTAVPCPHEQLAASQTNVLHEQSARTWWHSGTETFVNSGCAWSAPPQLKAATLEAMNAYSERASAMPLVFGEEVIVLRSTSVP